MAICFVMCVLLVSCAPARPVQAPIDVPPYERVVGGYNRNIAGLERLWARAVVELRWVEDGDRRFEQGDGHFIAAMPNRLALSVGKLGNVMFWAGGDESRYWFFDLRGSDDEHTATVGRHDRAEGQAASQLPVPVRPIDLPRLMGLVAIDPARVPGEPAVEAFEGKWMIEPPGTRTRLLLDPQTYRPQRIDLLDEQGRSRVVALLSNFAPVDTPGTPPGAWPTIPLRAEVRVIGQGGNMRLFLSDPNANEEKINPRVFDFERLRRALNAQHVRDLDE